MQHKIELLAQTAAHLAFVILAQPNVGELQWLPDPGSRIPPRTQRWSHPPLDDPLPKQAPHTQLHKSAWYAHLMEQYDGRPEELFNARRSKGMSTEDHARFVHRLHVDTGRSHRLAVLDAAEPVRKALRELHTMHHLRPALAKELARRAVRARTDQTWRTRMVRVLNELRLIWCGVAPLNGCPAPPARGRCRACALRTATTEECERSRVHPRCRLLRS